MQPATSKRRYRTADSRSRSSDGRGERYQEILGRHTRPWDNGRSTVSRRLMGPNRQCRMTIETGATADANTGGRRFSRRTRPERGYTLADNRTETVEVRYPRPNATASYTRQGELSYETPVNAPEQADTDTDEATNSDETPENNYDFDLPESTVPDSTEATTFSDTIDFPLLDPNHVDGGVRSPRRFNGLVVDKRITTSHWLGAAYDRGDLTADIVEERAMSSDEKLEVPFNPVMRWYHLERSMLNFEEFMSAAESILPVREKVRRDLVRLLRDVQRKSEHQRENGRSMEPGCVSDIFYTDPVQPDKQTASITFLAFPFHCLERYDDSQTRALAPGSPMHPLRPMLQAYFTSTTEKRELTQAVTSMPHARDSECIHVSQVWCLVVDHDLILTCSRLSFEALCGDVIRHEARPPSYQKEQIRVSVVGDRAWMVPISQQTSWPTFRSLFTNLTASADFDRDGFLSSIGFQSPKGLVTAKLWPYIREHASNEPVDLQLTVAPPPTKLTNPRGLEDERAEDTQGDAQNLQKEKPEVELDAAKMHDKYQNSKSSVNLQIFQNGDNPFSAQETADRLHQILLSNSRSFEREAYMACPSGNHTDIKSWLHRAARGDGETGSQPKRLDKTKHKFVMAALPIMTTFFPLTITHPMIDKFWGALNKILLLDEATSIPGIDNQVLSECCALQEKVRIVSYDLKQDFLLNEADLQPIPPAFCKAWLHYITSIVLIVAQASLRSHDLNRNGPINSHFTFAASELSNGRRTALSRLQFASMDDLEICTPGSLVALFADSLAKDITHGRPDVESVYSAYYQSLEFNVVSDPAPRSHQEKLRFFLQEVEAVLSTLQNQFTVLDAFDRSLHQNNNNSTDTNTLTATVDALENVLGESRRSIVLEQTRAALASKINHFTGLQSRATELGEWQRIAMETNKDRQEAAIMVFTIVTIIFLPLSFVSGVFGMNSNDIRNMKLNQWAYWAAALPLTLVVVVGSLWWAGFTDGLGSWLASTLRGGSGSRKGYVKMEGVDEPESNDRRGRRRSEEASRKPRGKPLFYPPPRRRAGYTSDSDDV